LCIQYIDLIVSSHCTSNKTWKLFLTSISFTLLMHSSPPVDLLSKQLLLFSSPSTHLNSCRVTNLEPYLNPSSTLQPQCYFQNAEPFCLNYFPLVKIQSKIFPKAPTALLGQVLAILCSLVSHLCLLMLWASVTEAYSWFLILVILTAITGPLHMLF